MSRYLLAVLLFCSCLHAENPSEKMLSSVFAMMGRGVCGTAFLLEDGRIVTNAHITRAVCEFGQCDSAKLFFAKSVEQPPNNEIKLKSLKLLKEIPSLDLALLAPTFETEIKGQVSVLDLATPKIGERSFVVGYPLCEKLGVSEGVITAIEDHTFLTSATINKGNSGSPILSANGKLQGVITQSGSISEGLYGLLLGGAHSGRGISAQSLSVLLSADDEVALHSEVELALKFYNDSLQQLSGISRVIPGLSFSVMVEGIMSRLLVRDDDGLVLKLLMSTLDDFPQIKIPNTPLYEDSELLALAYALETPADFLQPRPTKESFLAALSAAGRTPQHVAKMGELFLSFEQRGYMGLYPNCILLALGFVALILLWALSLGFTFARAGGGWIRRVFVTVIVAIPLWPLSFLIFLICNRRRKAT